MTSRTTKPLVLLTGATGFVGAHVFALLLSSGYRIKATIRSSSKGEFLSDKYASESADFSFTIVPDLQAAGALNDAVQDVDYICHMASPYFISATDPIKELVEPAVKGTKNVLISALKAPKLKRMTVLSSFASVVDLSKNPRAGYLYTEKDWDPVTTSQAAENGVLGYHASKTFAEQAAWEIWRSAKDKGEIGWDLCTFCPPMIYGPPIHEVHVEKGIESLNTSVKRVMEGILGRDPIFKPKVATPGLPHWVNVRDVAEAHLRALELERGTSERFLLCGGVNYYEDGLQGLREKGVKLGEVGEKIDTSKHFGIDVSRAKSILGLEFTPFEKTVEDVYNRVKELGFDI